MNTSEYKEVPYTIELDWEGGTVWLNNHILKEKMIVTEKVAKSIINSFLLINGKREGVLLNGKNDR